MITTKQIVEAIVNKIEWIGNDGQGKWEGRFNGSEIFIKHYERTEGFPYRKIIVSAKVDIHLGGGDILTEIMPLWTFSPQYLSQVDDYHQVVDALEKISKEYWDWFKRNRDELKDSIINGNQ